MKKHSHNLGTGREWEKNIPKIREPEGNEKIHSHNSAKGIRGFHSWEWTGMGIPAHPWYESSDCFDIAVVAQKVKVLLKRTGVIWKSGCWVGQ